MPHYRDGTEAKVGDLVRGVSYNREKRQIVGTIIQITPGVETCNCMVAFASIKPLPKLPDDAKPWHELLPAFGARCTYHSDGHLSVVLHDVDYGETREFELVARGEDVGASVPAKTGA